MTPTRLLAGIALLAALGCSTTETRLEAERFANRYYQGLRAGDVDGALAMCAPEFFESTPREEWLTSLGRIRDDGAAAGVALNPATPLSTLDEVLAEVDLVLIMSVHPGFGGQAFLPASLDKVRRLSALRRHAGHEFRIQVDGGVNLHNAGPLAEAGCDILVAGSSVFGADNIAEAVRELSARGRGKR